jgi:hypothetical protein
MNPLKQKSRVLVEILLINNKSTFYEPVAQYKNKQLRELNTKIQAMQINIQKQILAAFNGNFKTVLSTEDLAQKVSSYKQNLVQIETERLLTADKIKKVGPGLFMLVQQPNPAPIHYTPINN